MRSVVFATYIMAAMTLLGCSRGLEYSVKIDPINLTQDEIVAVEAAADQWWHAVPQLRLTITIGACDAWNQSDGQICVEGSDNLSIGQEQLAGWTHRQGMAKDGAGVFLWKHISGIQLENDAMHELGHAFGLEHTPDREDLMYVQLKPDLLTPPSLEDIDRFWGAR